MKLSRAVCGFSFCAGLVLLALPLPAPASEPMGFVFAGTKVAAMADQRMSVSLSERLPVASLKARFRSYSIRVAKGEDCLICATISGKSGSIEVNYDEAGKTVTGISSFDMTSQDLLGNKFGGSVRNAIGVDKALCDAGMNLTCESPKLKGLSYVIEDDEKCVFSVKERVPVEIPTCARIGGFQIN